jgi:hypothetical protein
MLIMVYLKLLFITFKVVCNKILVVLFLFGLNNANID